MDSPCELEGFADDGRGVLRPSSLQESDFNFGRETAAGRTRRERDEDESQGRAARADEQEQEKRKEKENGTGTHRVVNARWNADIKARLCFNLLSSGGV